MEENILRETPGQLARMNHQLLLKHIRAAFQQHPLFFWSRGRLVLDVHSIAQAVCQQNLTERDLVDSNNVRNPRVVTLHTDDLPKVQESLHEIITLVQDAYFQCAQAIQRSPTELTMALLEPITNSPLAVRNDKFASIAMKALKDVDTASRCEMTFQQPKTDPIRVMSRWQRLEISVDVPRNLPWKLAEDIKQYAITSYGLDRDLVEERLSDEVLASDPNARTDKQRTSSISHLCHALVYETVGQLKKEAIFCYLEYLANQLPGEDGPYTLSDLLHRLKRLRDFVQNKDNRKAALYTDEDYTIRFYGGHAYDIRVLFGPAYVYDDLPVIPDFEAHIGEVTDFKQDICTYTFGARMKLNGLVPTEGTPSPSSYEYHLRRLRGETREQQQYQQLVKPGKEYDDILRILILYYFAFAHADEKGFDPLEKIHTEIITPLNTISTQPLPEIQAKLREFAQMCSHGKPEVAVDQVVKLLQRKTEIRPRTWPIQLCVMDSILNEKHEFLNEPMRPDAFQPERKYYLRHLLIEPQVIDPNAVTKLKGTIAFKDIHSFESCSPDSPKEQLAVAYAHTDKMRMCRVLLRWYEAELPIQNTAPQEITPGLIIYLRGHGANFDTIHETRKAYWFVYRYVTSLLSYIGLATIAAAFPDPRQTFIAVARHHQHDSHQINKEDPEGFLTTLGKSLAFILGHDYLANSQGMAIDFANINAYADHQIRNAVESMYSVLPKRFKAGIDKDHETPLSFTIPPLALIVVSSRLCDRAHHDRTTAQATVYGEVVSIWKRDTDASVRIRRLRTFSGTSPVKDIPRRTEAVIEQVHKLYAEGYRHIIYLAQSPYTSKLHLVQGDEFDLDEFDRAGLYYLSPENIKAMLMKGTGEEERDDLYLYPIFRDEYPAFRIGAIPPATWEMTDMRELQSIITDKTDGRQMAVFFNLFSNKQVGGGPKIKRYYHSVVSYATLLQHYTPLINDRAIMGNLINDSEDHQSLMRALVLFHLARNETNSTEVIIKLDPYDNIIGTDSVGAHAVRQHINDKYQFNFLSFLSFVRETMKGLDA
jgi:hypothetical protein